jgi:hypothetical protein
MPLSRESRDIIDATAQTLADPEEGALFERVRIGLGHDGKPRLPDTLPRLPVLESEPTDDTVSNAVDGAFYLVRTTNRLYVRSGGVWMYLQLL